jgi:hypothetical protein
MAIAVVRDGGVQRDPAAPEVAVRIAEQGGLALLVVLAGEADAAAPAKEVVVLEVEAGTAFPAAAGHRDAGLERPYVLGMHGDVHDPVRAGQQGDLGIVEVGRGAQDALGLIEEAALEGLAGGEQQLPVDDRRAGADMEPVQEPEQRLVLLGIVEVEDVAVVDQDPADDGARCLEFRVGQVAPVGGAPGRRGGGQQAGQESGEPHRGRHSGRASGATQKCL